MDPQGRSCVKDSSAFSDHVNLMRVISYSGIMAKMYLTKRIARHLLHSFFRTEGAVSLVLTAEGHNTFGSGYAPLHKRHGTAVH